MLQATARASRWCVAAALVASALVVFSSRALPAEVVLAVSAAGLAAGVPHGAVDHLLLARAARMSVQRVVVLYAAAAVAAWAALTYGGLAAVVAVAVLSIVHFGLGEVEVYRATTGWNPGPAVAAAVTLAGTGALVLPLVVSGEVLLEVASAVSADLGTTVGLAPVRIGLAAAWGTAAVLAGVAAVRAGHRVVVLDLLLVAALGVLAPPLVAFAVWFGGWHALRHTGRLLELEPGCASLLEGGRSGAAFGRFARLAALPSSVALAALVVVVATSASAPVAATAVADGLRILLALTVPHMLAVLWLDRHPPASHTAPDTLLAVPAPRRRRNT